MRLIEESVGVDRLPAAPAPLPPEPDSLIGQVSALRARLQDTIADEVPEHEVLDALRGLEDLTRAAAAATARLSARFQTDELARQASNGVPASRRGRAVADDLALTRKTSPYRSSRELTASRALVTEMPHMLAALAAGDLDAGAARMVTEETVCLEPHHRSRIDELLAPRVPGMSTAQLRGEVRALAQELDPKALVRRARKAVEDRAVWVRPVPDVMALLSARLPAHAAIACHKALVEHATALKSSGDERSKGQIMADELFARLTGRSVAEGVDVEVQLVMTDASLFAGDPAAAILNGYGPMPAQSARDLLSPQDADATDEAPESAADDVRSDLCPDGPRCTKFSCTLLHGTPLPQGPAATPQTTGTTTPATPAPAARPPATPEGAGAAEVYLRRLYADPQTGRLTGRDTRRRRLPADLRATLVSRDQYCRTPWCGAPVRHADHPIRWADGGPTDLDSNQGLCERCNLARERDRASHLAPDDYLPPPPILPTFLRHPRAG